MVVADLRGKRVLVHGLGLHGGGVAVVRWLVKHGARVVVFDDGKTRRELAPSLRKLRGLPVTYAVGKRFSARLLNQVALLVQNPAVPREHPLLALARKRRIPIENEATLFLKLCPAQTVIGVTGTKGKSTTTALLGSMVRRRYPRVIVAGNIRDTVMFDALPRVTRAAPVVLELSSWHLEVTGEQRLRWPISVVTNVSPEHLNRYRSLTDYTRAKYQAVAHQRSGDAAVLNYDNPVTKKFRARTKARVYWFSSKRSVPRGVYVARGYAWWKNGAKPEALFRISDIRLAGAHNLQNVLAAATAARIAGVPPEKIRAAVRAFRGLHDRLELINTKRGIGYYNDTAATAPRAACAALAALAPRPVVIIAGGVDKKLEYGEMAKAIRRHALATVLLPGTATVKLQRELRGYKPQFLAQTMPQAVKLASTLVPQGGVVLLSPGAASFNLFRHEFHRGEVFRRAVARL